MLDPNESIIVGNHIFRVYKQSHTREVQTRSETIDRHKNTA